MNTDNYCEFEEATKEEASATFWDSIDGRIYGVTLRVAENLVKQDPFKTIDQVWDEAGEICVREDAYRDIYKQIDRYYNDMSCID
jgi:hypothetical protein